MNVFGGFWTIEQKWEAGGRRTETEREATRT
jgi:hypothetical protein